MYKATILLALVAFVSAGNVAYLDHHIGSAAEQTVRGFGGLSSVSTQSRAVNSAYTTSSAYKTKVTNNAVAYAQPALAYAQPAYAAPIAQPAYAAPIAQPIVRAAVAAPAYTSFSPVVPGVASLHFSGLGVNYAY